MGRFLCQLLVLCGIFVPHKTGTCLSYADLHSFTELLAAYVGAPTAAGVLVPMVSCPFCHPTWFDLNYTSSVITFVSWLRFHLCASQFLSTVHFCKCHMDLSLGDRRHHSYTLSCQRVNWINYVRTSHRQTHGGDVTGHRPPDTPVTWVITWSLKG